MAGEGRARRPEEPPPSPTARVDTGAATLGLIPAPDILEKIAKELAEELPDLLGRHVDPDVYWDVPVVVDPLTGSGRESPEILDVCRERRLSEGWDLAICLTDLPVYRGGRLVAGDVSGKPGVAGLSLPALGAARLHQRARDLTLQLARELYARTSHRGRDHQPGRGPRSGEAAGPFRRVDPPDEDMRATDVEVRFAAPGARGRLGLWSGMVLANRPWRMLPAFKGAIAAAFATGAYVLVITTLWLLADSVGWARLLLLMVTAIVAMVACIIVAHHLWERPEDPQQRRWAPLYNGVSVLTVTSAVLCAYALLFALILLAAWVFVPGAYFQSILKHSVGFGEYLTLSWLSAPP